MAPSRPIVISRNSTWDMDGSQHPSLGGNPLRLLANTPTEVEPDQVPYLTSLQGVELLDVFEAPVPPSAPETETPAPATGFTFHDPEEAPAPSHNEEA